MAKEEGSGTAPPPPAPAARVRLWELIAFQAVFAGCVGWRRDLLVEFPRDSVLWSSVLIHGAATALLVFVVGDLRLRDAARFSAPGRIGLVAGGIVGIYALAFMHRWRGRPHGFAGIDSLFVGSIGFPWLLGAIILGFCNVFVSRPKRDLWRWLSLLSAMFQLGSLWEMARG